MRTLALVLSFSVFSGNVFAAELTLPFSDSFDGGPTAPGTVSGWTHGPDSDPWEINGDDQLHIVTVNPDASENNIWAGDPAAVTDGDITITFDVECAAGGHPGLGRNFGVFFYSDSPGARDDGGTGIRHIAVEWIDGDENQRPDSSGFEGVYYNPGRLIADQVKGPGNGAPVDPPRQWRITAEDNGNGQTHVRMWGDGVLYLDYLVGHSQVAPTGYVGMWAWVQDVEICIDNFKVEPGAILPPFACFDIGSVNPIPRVGEEVTFDASCSGSPGMVDSWDWDFGDGNSDEGEVVQHTYDTANTYTVTLTIGDDQGNEVTIQKVVQVVPEPESILPFFDDFSGGPAQPGEVPGWTEGTNPASDPWDVNFQGQLHIHTQNPPTANECNIWAGNPAGAANGDITITFDVECASGGHPGLGRNFGVFFYADAPGARDDGGTGIRNIAIEWIDGPVDQRPSSSGFEGVYYNPGRLFGQQVKGPDAGVPADPPEEWHITAEDNNNGQTRVRMWGDGVQYLDFLVGHSQVSPTGHIGVWAWVQDVEICIDDFSVEPGITAPPSPPMACFEVSGEKPVLEVDTVLTFDASCSTSPGTVTSWDWDFGDGENGSDEIVQHSYDTADTYMVTLTIGDDDGNEVSIQQEVEVLLPPESILPFFDDFSGGPAQPGEVSGWTEGTNPASDPWDINFPGQLHIHTQNPPTANEANIWAGDPVGVADGDITITFDVECANGGHPGHGRFFGVFFYADVPQSRGNRVMSAISIEWGDGDVNQRPASSGFKGIYWDTGEFIVERKNGPADGVPADPPSQWRITAEDNNLGGETRVRMWGDGVPYLDFVVPHFNVSPTGHVGLWAWVQDVEICIDNFEVTEGVPPDSPTGLVATAADGAVDLEWDDNLDLDLQFYSVYRSEMSGSNFAVIAQPTESDYQDTDVVNGVTYYYTVSAVDDGDRESEPSAETEATPESRGVVFRRGDCDHSGVLDFNDAIFHLRFLFLGENQDGANRCRDACDSDDSGEDDFNDDIHSLKVLFLGQGEIPFPGLLPDDSHPCGVDPTMDDVAGCVVYEATIACP